MNALILCISIVLVFVLNKIPFLVVYLAPWKLPNWFTRFAIIVFPFDHILNSIIYLVQKYRRNAQASARFSARSNITIIDWKRNTIKNERV